MSRKNDLLAEIARVNKDLDSMDAEIDRQVSLMNNLETLLADLEDQLAMLTEAPVD